ncbi:phosphotransferase [Clostridium sp. YIM B02505]|uniref:Phosphotransferase n=1 Tax=Clostridium yunnanense TaxID=2800325 RepID=A0ABS1EJK1_9CLOT|nr:aminoglycoside phosphotransferase family protein [Clostridium yunnanense]MBK1809541.1 phosphotransferase [Clostridium yunnanense]
MEPLLCRWIESKIGTFIIVSDLEGGWGTHNNIRYLMGADGRNYCLKLFDNIKKWKVESIAYNELLNFESELIPKYYGGFSYGNINAILISRLKGQTLASRINEFDDSYKKSIFYESGKLSREIEDKNIDKANWFGALNLDISATYETASEYLKSKFYKHIAFLDVVDTDLAELYKKSFNLIDKIYIEEPPVLVNEDNTVRNWMVDSENRLTGIVDFEYLTWGIKAQTVSAVVLKDEYIIDAYFKGYGVDRDVLSNIKYTNYLALLGISTIIYGKVNNIDKAVFLGNRLIAKYKGNKI